MIVGMLSDRRHTRLISEFGGLKAVTPRLVAAFLLVTLSSIALPGLNGFVGEFLILVGAFQWSPRLTVLAATGVILSAVYMLWMFQRVNYGPVTNDKNRTLPDLTVREYAMLVPTIAMAILMGVVPGIFLKPMEPSVNRLIERVTANQPARVDNRSGAASPVVPALDLSSPAGRRQSSVVSAVRDVANPEPRPPNPDRRTPTAEPRTTDRAPSK